MRASSSPIVLPAAAAELDITPSAVSHQLQLLDAFIQTPLTVRDGRPLALADEGRDYYRSISAAFSVLRSATRFVRDRSSLRQITISLIPLFGIGWFIPRLHAFLAENTDVDVTVLYAHHRNYRSDASDLSIRFGTGDWPGYRCERLLPGAMTPMCSASFLERHGPFRTPADLAHAPLVHDEDRSAWVNWLQGAGVRHVSHAVGPMFEDGQLTLSAALVERELASGELVRLFDHVLDDGRDYYLCTREDTDLPDGAGRLAAWLRHMAAA
ncbi:LysR family transcriptional regulator [Burkholderia ubonensis]|uniref:LysR family transcriptional regulator n=1 Tax=Burkholderia ubonensis TaxID=101571 RepID=A0AA40R3Y0_9BURK|nr:LysR substrate-binding domain-containing protein [Burkholderia ubonensis]KVU21516.1 LysR family transcriptional regulator [Burkholderia ubonensis]KWZ52737.1 LysR family transcriptional regulator [Burkholderia ubonensis]